MTQDDKINHSATIHNATMHNATMHNATMHNATMQNAGASSASLQAEHLMTEQDTYKIIELSATVNSSFNFEPQAFAQGIWFLLRKASLQDHNKIDQSEKVIISVGKFQVAKEERKNYLDRLKAIIQIEELSKTIIQCGLDPEGTPFAVFNLSEGQMLKARGIDPEAREKRFATVLRIVSRLHGLGIIVGDICPAAFWVNADEQVFLVSILGSPKAVAADIILSDFRFYLSPERKATDKNAVEQSLISDVYALGVLAFDVVASANLEMLEDGGRARRLSSLKLRERVEATRGAPAWLEEVLAKSLSPDLDFRAKDAQELVKVMVGRKGKATSVSAYQEENTLEEEAKVEKIETFAQAAKDMRQRTATSHNFKAQNTEEGTKSSKVHNLLWLKPAAAVVILAVIAAKSYFWWRSSKEESVELRQDLAVHSAAVSDQGLKQAISGIGVNDADISEKTAYFAKMRDSDDPIAQQVLLDSALEAKSAKVRKLAQNALLGRAKRLGLNRTVEIIGPWADSVSEAADFDHAKYEAAMKGMDSTLPIPARIEYLKKIFSFDPTFGKTLTAAIALDSSDSEAFQPLLADFFSSQGQPELATKSVSLMVLSDKDLNLLFGQGIVPKAKEAKSEEIPALLEVLSAKVQGITVSSVAVELAGEAVSRNLVPVSRKLYLEFIRDKKDIPPSVANALVKFAFDKATKNDFESLGKWLNADADKVLLNICAESENQSFVNEAFETVSSKTLTVEPAASLLIWIKNNHWAERAQLERAFCILSNPSASTDEKLVGALNIFAPFTSDDSLIAIFMGSADPRLLELCIKKFNTVISVPTYLTLLTNDAKNVRISAIEGLKSVNDVGALKLIIDLHKLEKDADVKKKYLDTFWVIQNKKDDF